MPLQYDPEFLSVFGPLVPRINALPKGHVHDVERRRAQASTVKALFEPYPDFPAVEEDLHHVTALDGYQIPVRSFQTRQKDQAPGPAILHFHGGGMIMGSVEASRRRLVFQTGRTGVPCFSVDYRLAPEHAASGLVRDCYEALLWLLSNVARHNIDPARIAVQGDSAGGGLAVAVALMARDKELLPPLAKQILLYPMLDDRTTVVDEALRAYAYWTYDDNQTGWSAVLGDDAGKPGDHVSYYAAPARAKGLAGLPATYMDVGGLDIFRDEDMAFASRLVKENIDTEFHLYPGVPHIFDQLAPNVGVTKRAWANRFAAMRSF